jgi:hypothetical protein
MFLSSICRYGGLPAASHMSRDIKDAATKLESYLGKQKVAKPVVTRRRRSGDNSGTIGQATPLAEKRTRVN